MGFPKNKMVLKEIAVRINRMLLTGLFDLVIGILAIVVGFMAPTTTTTFLGYGLLLVFGFLIGILAIAAGILAILNAIGIPIAIITDVFPSIVQFKAMQGLALAKAFLCFFAIILVFSGTCTWTTMTFYIISLILDIALAYYGKEIIDLIIGLTPPALRFKFKP